MILQEDTEPGREKTLQMRVLDLERKRYENARWWRNLNRWMIPLGLVIITIVVGVLSCVPITLANSRCRSHWLLWERRWASSVYQRSATCLSALSAGHPGCYFFSFSPFLAFSFLFDLFRLDRTAIFIIASWESVSSTLPYLSMPHFRL